jgi:signal transduction histidine kinase
MHDNLGQVLGFINLQAQGIRQELRNSGIEIAAHSINKLVDATQAAHNEIREYIHNVRNMDSLEKDLITVLEKDIIGFEEQTGIFVERDIPIGFTGEELEPSVLPNILNIVREALNNIRKHALASHVKITFLLTDEQLRVNIEDNGKGFEISQNANCTKNKFGLSIMRERASEIGAQIDIKSVVGKGSQVIFSVPIRKG